ncbi:hypothetical protein BKA58DRAFT_406399 [Alternaria rosae]|uniref:uncharacterized protein n=1 Tax=Alternaria rosae TaxID=1187941 RepID=UPI001E8E649B|nr:uncharacterized protein BKA58DRAFT_406399 [Alternaria rosae]KAH6852993.1 hypothetical protein BKA58DRAFT_406399 [Alternaria rosae]
MANPPSYPANPNLTSNPPPPSTSSQSNVAFTPSATSIADSSDNEFEPTPIHSPVGPQYEDLPPSYDEARDQAVHDTRHGIAPVDPSQIEAHRITSNEGPNEPEVWEYRVRGEETDPASEQERAPDYANYRNDKATSVPVPVQHVSTSEDIAVGRVHSGSASSSSRQKQPDLASDLLAQALEFSREEPDAKAQYAPLLNRIIAIPDHAGPARRVDEHVVFLVAYAEVLDRHSIGPAEFAEFLYGLQVLTTAANSTAEHLLHGSTHEGVLSTIVHDYIRGANEAFFAPRGLIVSFRSQTALLDMLPIPAGHKPTVLANLADVSATAEWRARQLYPWIEALDADAVPMRSERVLKLHEMSERFSGQKATQGLPGHAGNRSFQSAESHEDPPHSIPGPPEESLHAQGRHGRGNHHPRGRRGGHWSPFGMPGHGPFGAPGNGPFGAPSDGPFGRGGRGGPFGPRGNAFFGRGGCSSRGGRGRGRGPPQSGNEWAEVGKELGKFGEQFGKQMGELGVEIGKRASAFGVEVGRMAGGNAGGSGSVSVSGNRGTTATSGPASYHQVHDDLPPAYAAPSGQETGVLHGDRKVNTAYPTDTKDKGKSKARNLDDDDDDTSSLSSDSSDSSSDSSDSDYDSDSDFTPATTPKAQSLKLARRNIKQRSRALKKDHKAKKRELRTKAKHSSPAATDRGKDKGKGKKKAKKDPEWKAAKKEYKVQKKELKKERAALKKEWRGVKEEGKREKRGAKTGVTAGGISREVPMKEGEGKQGVWLVIENLAP